MSTLVAGLFGKLPAHGDFVQRGWPAEVVAALDGWLTAGLAAERAANDDETFAARLSGAPLWQGYLPPGTAGPLALHLALAPSIDKAGRYFFLTGGIAGEAAAVWAAAQAPAFGAAAEGAVYDALAGTLDADAMHATLNDAVTEPDARARLLAGAALPTASAWWIAEPEDGAPVFLSAARADNALLSRLLDGGAA